jgi:hypothetical protein
MAAEHDFSDINEANAPRTMGELRELTENKPISREQFKHLANLGTKRTDSEAANKPAPVPDGMANPNLDNLESEVNSQSVPCINCGTAVPRDIHEEELGYCPECSSKYFHHYPVVGSQHHTGDECRECAVCGKHSATDEEHDSHTCFE